jgi:polyisoprenoid-binding protein YceI
MRSLLAFAVFAALAASVTAQTALGPDDIQAGTYVIDTNETLVRYGTIHMGFNEFWGTFPGATGTMTIDPKALAGTKLDVTVPIATVETTNRVLNGYLFSDDFFDAGKYPRMHFVSTDVTRTGTTTAKVTGNLTLHGITRQVVLDVTFIGAGPNAFTKVPTIGFKAEGDVKRSDFGIGRDVPLVSDETTITISAAFERKPDVAAPH